MDNLKALGRGTQLMFISAVLLLIVSFFHWQQVDFGPVSAGRNAWHGFFGVVMGILTIVLIARVAARLAAVEVPIPLSFATTSFVLGVLIAVCGVLKVLTDDYRHFWGFIGAVLAILVAVGAWLEVKEAGGMEHLRSEASSLGAAASSAASSSTSGTSGTSGTAEAASDAGGGASPAPTETAGSAASEAAEAAPEAAGSATDTARGAADAVEGEAEHAGGAVGEAASEAADDAMGGPSTGSGA